MAAVFVKIIICVYIDISPYRYIDIKDRVIFWEGNKEDNLFKSTNWSILKSVTGMLTVNYTT